MLTLGFYFKTTRMKRISLLLLNSITFIVTLYLNYLYGSGAGGRKSVGEISNQFDVLITPAGYAFSIWGLIYLLLTGFIIYQWVVFFKDNKDGDLEKTSIWLGLSNIFNALWIVVWTNEQLLPSVFVIFLLLVSLLKLGKNLGLGKDSESSRIFVQWPIGIYIGWIIVASVVNLSVWIYTTEVFSHAQVLWTNIVLVVAAFIYAIFAFKTGIMSSVWVGVWAFGAIAFKQWENERLISLTALFLIIVLVSVIFLKTKSNKKHAK